MSLLTPPLTIAYFSPTLPVKQRVYLTSLAVDYYTIDVSRYGDDIPRTVSYLAPDYLIIQGFSAQVLSGGFELLKQIRAIPKLATKCIALLNASELVSQQYNALDLSGYLPIDFTDNELLDCLTALAKGYRYTGDRQAKLAHLPCQRQLISQLTEREKEVVKLIGQGYSNKEIADLLFISVKTVETHKLKLIHKLAVQSSSELRHLAITIGRGL
ncbi:response regulator transcription factor [Fibrella aquatilis]|uniref:Response regulator transcription factor n=1 Tax=Fibrella aquatilis TaxID=2817059 RepID=A0A939JX39_9BACT|nr:response regulator transcription factor [Fibrella aquatilis]MBO0930639.1 response regulator transcription factor [Fibrella aquatilis]